MTKKNILLIIALSAISLKGFSQNVDSTSNTNQFVPDIDGVIKTKVEFNTEQGKMRFEVRNARFGAKGKVNNFMSYKAEVDLSDEGKIKMLDAYVQLSPIKNLDLYLGQRKVPFGSDYMRSLSDNIFANRSFVSKYLSEGLRDIGFMANYKINCIVPIEIWAAATNGTGYNNPQWIEEPNYSGRVAVSPFKNFRIATNFYQGSSILEKKRTILGGELRYQTKNFLIETEFMQRKYSDTSNVEKEQQGIYVHTYYNFNTKCKMVRKIAPVLRWDMMGEDVFGNKKSAERITGGVTLGLDVKQFVAEIHLNYEDYLMSDYTSHFDKFVIEFVAKF